MMKIISMKNIFAALITVLLLTSCEELLDVNTIEDPTPEELLVSAYNRVSGVNDGSLYGGDLTIIHDLISYPPQQAVLQDESSLKEFFSKDITNLNAKVELNWSSAYAVINVCNNILEDSLIDEKPSVKGEALAMRAMMHFELARLWGAPYSETTAATDNAVPLLLKATRTQTDNQKPVRVTVQALYSQVEQDLTAAAGLLKGTSISKDRISYFTVNAFLMRVALEKKNYADVETFADEVLTGGFALTDTPIEAFDNVSPSSEDIFALAQTATENAGDRTSGTGLPAFFSSLEESGNTIFVPFQVTLENTFALSTGDLRYTRESNTSTTTTADDVEVFYYKPTDIDRAGQFSVGKFKRNDRVIPIVRAAEIYLCRAEALAELSFPVVSAAAITDLNMVRNRAGLASVMTNDFNNALELIDSIRVERKRELAFEGHLLNDLRRWGEDVSLGVPALDEQLILPVPASETQVSGLE